MVFSDNKSWCQTAKHFILFIGNQPKASHMKIKRSVDDFVKSCSFTFDRKLKCLSLLYNSNGFLFFYIDRF